MGFDKIAKDGVYSAKGRRSRFLVFAWDNYYPDGGMNDCVYAADTLGEAIRALEEHCANRDDACVFDTHSGEEWGFSNREVSEAAWAWVPE